MRLLTNFAVRTGLLSVVLTSSTLLHPLALAQEKEKPSEAKPLATVSIAPLERTMQDLNYLLNALNATEVSVMLETMAGGFTKGIDKTRPIAIAVSLGTDDQPDAAPNFVACVPMADHNEWFSSLKENGIEPEDLGDGVYEIAAPGQYVYGKIQDGWFYVAQTEDSLENLPQDPINLVGDLPTRYTFAVRVDLEQLSAEDRKRIFEQMQSQVEGNLAQQFGDQLPEGVELAAEADEESVEQIDEWLSQTQQIVIGLLIDATEKNIYADMAVQFMPGTKLATQMESQIKLQSDLTAVRLPDSAADLRMASVLATDDDKKQAREGIHEWLEKIGEGIENSGLSEERAGLIKKLVESSTKVIDQTIDQGVVDIAASVRYNDDVLQALAGIRVADGRAIETQIKEFVAGFAKESKIEVESDYATHAGWSLHRVRAKLPETEKEATALLGSQVELFVAGSDKLILVSLDPDGDQTLRATIDKMKAAKSVDVTPLELTVHVGDLIRLMQKVKPEGNDEVGGNADESSPEDGFNDMLEGILDAVKSVGDNDQVKVTGTSLPRGFVMRVAVQEGVLKTFGSTLRSFSPVPGF